MTIASITPTARVLDALAFAAHAHRHQRRKDEDLTPYINHPIALMRILGVEAGIDDPDVLCAAALHDYIEDCCGGNGEPTVEQGKAIVPTALAHKCRLRPRRHRRQDPAQGRPQARRSDTPHISRMAPSW